MNIQLQNVTYTYAGKYQRVTAVDGVSYTFHDGTLYTIMGASGSGKSTLLSLLAGLKLPTEGEITLDEQPIRLMDRSALRRDTVSVIYQDFNLFPLLTAEENVCYPLRRVCRSAAGGGDRRQHPQVRRPAGVQVPGVQAHGRPPRHAEHRQSRRVAGKYHVLIGAVRQVHPHGFSVIGGPLVVQIPHHRVVAVAADHGPCASGPLVPNFDLDFRHLHHLPSDTPARGVKVAPAVAVSVFADS